MQKKRIALESLNYSGIICSSEVHCDDLADPFLSLLWKNTKTFSSIFSNSQTSPFNFQPSATPTSVFV